MASGGPGDHPFTDIVHHGMPVFSARVDAIVREIAGLADERTRRQLADRLLALSPTRGPVNLSAVEQELETMRDRLRHDAKARGWEPPTAGG